MEFGDDWQIKFVERTLDNLSTASPHINNEATMLVNSMLGLLVLPREKMISELPDISEHELSAWGITAGSVKCFGNQRQKREGDGLASRRVNLDYGPKTLKGVVHSLRNAVCHFGIEPIEADKKVTGFKFRDWDSNGFKAEFTNESIKSLCKKLAEYLVKQLKK